MNVSQLVLCDQSPHKVSEFVPDFENWLITAEVSWVVCADQVSLVYKHPQLWQVWCVLDSSLKLVLTKASLVADMSNKKLRRIHGNTKCFAWGDLSGKKMKYVIFKTCSITNQVPVTSKASREVMNWVYMEPTIHSFPSKQVVKNILFSVKAVIC